MASTHAYLLIFTNKGRVYWLKIYNIPDATTTGKGKNISNLINLQPDETVKAFLPVKDFPSDTYVVMVTKNGIIKKCQLTEFNHPLQRGIIALGVEEGDELIFARLSSGNNFLFLGTHRGQAIRFSEKEVRAMGRPAYGVNAMDLEDGDYIVGGEVVENDGLILSISENGYGKRTPLKDYRLIRRGGKGVINMKTNTRNGRIVAILSVNEDSDLMIVTKDGKMIRIDANDIRQTGPFGAGRLPGEDGAGRPGGGGLRDTGGGGPWSGCRQPGRFAAAVDQPFSQPSSSFLAYSSDA